MTDEERALVGRAHRIHTPAHGTPIHTPDPDDFTPVGDVLHMVPEADRIMYARLWQHTANMEMRWRDALKASETGRLREDVDDLAIAVTDIHGARGTNGKLGELRRRVDALTKRAWSILTIALGGLGAAAVKLVIVTRAFDATEARARHNEVQVQLLQAQVATLQTALIARRYRPTIEPGKDPSP